MPEKITEMTPEQEAQLDPWAQKWIQIGLSTERAETEKGIEAGLNLYDVCDVKRPKIALAFESPYATVVGGVFALEILDGLGRKKNESDFKKVVGKISVGELNKRIFEQTVQQFAEKYIKTEQPASFFLEDKTYKTGQKMDKEKVRQSLYNSYGGSLYSAWPSFVTFLRDVLNWENPELENFKHYENLSRTVGWAWWHEEVFAVSDRPEQIKLDDEGRLHCEEGPAIKYRDGWGVYSWHGTKIPGEWIENKESLTASVALTWSNIEERRCACEILGWDNILEELNAQVVDDSGDPEIGVLLECEIPEIGRERFLRVRCGTGRQFALPVPQNMRTAKQAQAWTWNLDEDSFVKPEVRT
jgi:hypothetical protein